MHDGPLTGCCVFVFVSLQVAGWVRLVSEVWPVFQVRLRSVSVLHSVIPPCGNVVLFV